MSLSPGTRLGIYEITGILGQGGMGEVYRARDTRLNRDVAIKVLPALFAVDPGRLARFEREAQALAALNHPNIAHIHGVIDLPRPEGGRSAALIMECVEGEDLAQRMARERIPLDEALHIARQIAGGLEDAHDHGIVHRDLKPANIKVAPDGAVKVLDFGLATSAALGAHTDPFNSPTFTSPAAMTQAGLILGTAAYMAPEQARGKVVDRRADIWAFGCVLYEMLCGARPFDGESLTDVLSAIVSRDPDWTRVPAGTPVAVRALLERCLERDPRRRLRDIGEARIVLEDPKRSSGDAAIAPAVHSLRTSRWLYAALGVVSVVAVTAIALLLKGDPPTVQPEIMRFDIDVPSGSSVRLVERPAIAIASNGSVLAYTVKQDGRSEIHVRRRTDATARVVTEARIENARDGADIALSPDGRWLAFTDGAVLYAVPTAGGPLVRLASVATSTRGVTWLNDRTVVYSPGPRTGLWAVDVNGGGAQRQITNVDTARGERSHRWPAALPGGRSLIFTVGTLASPDSYDDASIDVADIGSGARHRVLERAASARYQPGAGLIFERAGSLYAIPFDLGTRTAGGTSALVVKSVAIDPNTGAAHVAVADDGTMVYVHGSPGGVLRRLDWVDRSGAAQSIDLKPAVFNDPRVSPDGTRIALMVGPLGHGDIWIYDVRQTTFSRLTSDGSGATPVWSSDGRAVYYASIDTAARRTTIYKRPADGSRAPEAVATIDRRAHLGSIDEARQMAYCAANEFTGSFDILRLPLRSGAAVETLVSSPLNDYSPDISPDGRWLAYASEESGLREVYVRSLARDGARWPVSTGGGEEPHWAPDGRTLYYRVDGRLMTVPIAPGDAFIAGKPSLLFRGVYNLQSETGGSYNVDPRTGRLLMIRLADEHAMENVTRFQVVVNWPAEVRRLLAEARPVEGS